MEKEKVELIKWSDRLSCGITLIDKQHKEMVAMVNEMYNHITGDEKQETEYFNKIINKAVSYIKIHFATEEKLMLAAKMPGFARHKKAHNQFILEVLDNIHYYETGRRTNLYVFTKYLKDWILSHIALMDIQYFGQLAKTGKKNIQKPA